MKQMYIIRLEPLTAIHIGTGTALTPLDYLVQSVNTRSGDEKKLYCVFSSDKLLQRLCSSGNKAAIDEFNRMSTEFDINKLRTFFHKQYCAQDIIYPCETSPEFLSVYNSNRDLKSNALEVQQLYRPKGSKMPVIPGSSLKGAIRTALLNWELSNLSDSVYNKMLTKSPEVIQKDLFGYADPKNDALRAISVGDTPFPAKGSQFVGQMQNIWLNNHQLSETGMQMFAEMIPGSLLKHTVSGECRVCIDVSLQRAKIIDKNRPFKINKRFDIQDVCEACNYFFKREFDREYKYFYAEAEDKTQAIEQLKTELDDICTKSDCFIVRLGRWSQIEFVTLEENFRRPGKEYGNTRTVLSYNGRYYPAGWCKCTIIHTDKNSAQS